MLLPEIIDPVDEEALPSNTPKPLFILFAPPLRFSDKSIALLLVIEEEADEDEEAGENHSCVKVESK